MNIEVIKKSFLKMDRYESPEILSANHLDRYHDEAKINWTLDPWEDGYYDEWDGYKHNDDLDCIMDNYIVNPSSTFRSGKTWNGQQIIFNSDTVEKEKYNNDFTQMTTKCGWFHGVDFRWARYDLNLIEFEIPGCNDCSCGSLDIYSTASRPATLLARVCTYNKTETISLNISRENLLIQFQSNVILPKKLELNLSVTPISIYGKFSNQIIN